MSIDISVTSLPELLNQLRAAHVSVFRYNGLELIFEAAPAPPAVQAAEPRQYRMAPPETDPDKAPINPIDACLDPPPFELGSVE